MTELANLSLVEKGVKIIDDCKIPVQFSESGGNDLLSCYDLEELKSLLLQKSDSDVVDGSLYLELGESTEIFVVSLLQDIADEMKESSNTFVNGNGKVVNFFFRFSSAMNEFPREEFIKLGGTIVVYDDDYVVGNVVLVIEMPDTFADMIWKAEESLLKKGQRGQAILFIEE